VLVGNVRNCRRRNPLVAALVATREFVGELWEVPHHFVTQVLVAAVDAAARIEREAVDKFNLARLDEGCEGLHSPRG